MTSGDRRKRKMSNTIVASLGDILLSTEDVETLDEWLNDQASS